MVSVVPICIDDVFALQFEGKSAGTTATTCRHGYRFLLDPPLVNILNFKGVLGEVEIIRLSGFVFVIGHLEDPFGDNGTSENDIRLPNGFFHAEGRSAAAGKYRPAKSKKQKPKYQERRCFHQAVEESVSVYRLINRFNGFEENKFTKFCNPVLRSCCEFRFCCSNERKFVIASRFEITIPLQSQQTSV